MRKLLITSVLVFSLILLPNITHAQTIKDRVLGLFRYFQGSGLAAVKHAPLSQTNGPVSGDGIVYSSDALYTWSGTNPETLLITQGTVTFTTNTTSQHPNLIVTIQGGTALFQVSNSLNTLNLNGGSATLATGTNNVLTTKSLSITGSSYLDITNGGVIVDYSGSPTTLLTTIKGYITSARGCLDICDPAWSGLGIRSSSAAVATPDRDLVAIGYADNANLEIHGPYTTFMGQTLPDSTVILIRFTQSGDTDLDGKVGDNDVTMLGAYYAPLVSNRHFFQGDADYTGKVGDSDVTLLGAQYDEFVQTSNLVAQANTTSVTLYWDKFVNYSGNTTILKQIGGGAQFQLTTTPNSTLTDSAVTPGTIYTYQVKGTNGHLSNLIQVKVPATQPNCGTLCVPAYSSKPGAPVTIYLDFDGDPATTWYTYTVPPTPAYDVPVYDPNTGQLVRDPSSFSATELANINEIWQRVSEAFSPFNVNVTTVDPGSYPYRVAEHIIIGGDGSWITTNTLSGTAATGSFYDTTKLNRAYVFSVNTVNGTPKPTAEQVAHELGITFGMYDQSVYNSAGTRTNQFNPGTNLFAPYLGATVSSVRGMWWVGTSWLEWYDFSRAQWVPFIQDDMSYIASATTSIAYRPDDYGNTTQTASAITGSNPKTKSGIIEQSSDVDYFSFTTTGGSATLRVDPAQYGSMLDPKIILYNAAGQQIAQADASYIDRFHPYPGDIITITLSAGTYYISIQGHGMLSAGVYASGNDLGKGMDVGQYTVTVTAP
jgi:hypothetical protein